MANSSKVLLPRDVANALTEVIEERGKSWMRNLPSIHRSAKKNDNVAVLTDFLHKEKGGYELLQEATVLGFEADASPEEKLLDYYNSLDPLLGQDAIRYTLELLEIKVKGINA